MSYCLGKLLAFESSCLLRCCGQCAGYIQLIKMTFGRGVHKGRALEKKMRLLADGQEVWAMVDSGQEVCFYIKHDIFIIKFA